MKRIIALSVILGILFIGSAFGAVQETAKFSVDVPEGWTFTPQRPRNGIRKKRRHVHAVGVLLEWTRPKTNLARLSTPIKLK